jgi:S1-C subfamily serine protease
VRPVAVAVIALAAALVGGAVVYLLGAQRDDTPRVLPGKVVVAEVDASGEAGSAPLRPTGGFDPERIYAARSPGVVTLYVFYGGEPADEAHAAQGSGFVVSPDGYVLTSAHVITTAGQGANGPTRPAKRVYVGFSDGDRVEAEVVGYDLFDDVGVVRVARSAHALRPVPLGNSSLLRVGAPVAAIGSPFGNTGSLAVGVVSAVGRSIPSLTSLYALSDAIQTDAPITHGNSGGPLLDARGTAVGINAQIRTDNGAAEGVGFAVPIDAAKRSLRQLIATGRVRYPYVGIRTDDLTPTLARHLRLPVLRGALVRAVTDGSPADKAGVRGGDTGDTEYFNGAEVVPGGDVVVAIGGRPVRSSDDVARTLVEHYRPGDTVTFTVVRDGRRSHAAVRLGTRPAIPDTVP